MIIDCAHYKDGVRQNEETMPLEEASRCVTGEGEFVWLGLFEPGADEMHRVQELFDLHELAVEDAYVAHQRPKLEDYEGSYFIVLKTARYDEEREEVDFGEIQMFASRSYVIHVRHGEASGLKGARHRLEHRRDILRVGPAAVVWAILDQVVDDYTPVVDGIESDIEEVESEVFEEHEEPTQRIYKLKREVIEFHRAVWPLMGPLGELEGGGVAEIDEHLRRYFRDVADHARRVDEQVTSQRELLTSVLEANLALVSVRQNEVVKQISSYAAIIAVPTFIASVYGMNFEHMPELHQRWGYPIALLVMAASVAALIWFFKRIRWI